jgi:hypothetical protein
MAFMHGKNTFISVGGADLSAYTNASEIGRKREVHQVTTYGKDAHVKSKGLKDGTFSMSGTYDNTAGTGPRAVLLAAYEDDDNLIEIIRRPEGTGSGKPQDRFDAACTSYTETNPVADMVTWSADFEISDLVNTTAQ